LLTWSHSLIMSLLALLKLDLNCVCMFSEVSLRDPHPRPNLHT
jgi:hypothetical protein